MDTKSLYDAANEAGLNFAHDDGYNDARQVWIDAWMDSPEHLADVWIDALAELHDDKKKDALTGLLGWIGKLHEQVEQVTRYGGVSTGMKLTLGVSTTQNAAFLGSEVYQAVLEFLEAWMDKYAEEYWADCCSYHSDMIEGQYADYKYQEYKDRQLEERE